MIETPAIQNQISCNLRNLRNLRNLHQSWKTRDFVGFSVFFSNFLCDFRAVLPLFGTLSAFFAIFW